MVTEARSLVPNSIHELINSEMTRASKGVLTAYLLGAMHDGTRSALHKTLRIAQGDLNWMSVLRTVLEGSGSRAWTYQEGGRNTFVVEAVDRLPPSLVLEGQEAIRAYARGYFDAEGGIPRSLQARFYVQFVQKDLSDLSELRSHLEDDLQIGCGRIHNPSKRVDPEFWRFYVRAAYHGVFSRGIGSWHPRKRLLLETRFPHERG